MATISMALPVLPGKSGDLRKFCGEVTGARRAEFEASEKRIGLTREGWYFQPTPMGDLAIIWVEGNDPIASLVSFVGSQEPFDRWFKEEVKGITGVDLNEPPAALPEVLFDWSAAGVGVR